MIVGQQRFVISLLPSQQIAQPDPDIDKIRLELQRQIVALQRFFQAIQTLQQRPQIRKIIGYCRIDPDRLRDQINGLAEPIGAGSNEAKQVQRIGMFGVAKQRLPAMLFGGFHPAGAKVKKGRIVEARRRFLCTGALTSACAGRLAIHCACLGASR